jgi:hypothetical protein
MQVVTFTAKRARTQPRHHLRTLAYVTLDEANGGIVRNVNRQGIAVQTVVPLRPGQQVRVSFELRQPRLPVEARGEVSWADSSGQAGIRFLDLPAKKMRQVDEWIFGNLLECAPQHAQRTGSLFEMLPGGAEASEMNGLLLSPTPRKVIPLEPQAANVSSANFSSSSFSSSSKADQASIAHAFDLDWLSRPLSGRALALAIDTLVVFAAMLLFFLVFFSVSSELPEWPMNVALGLATTIFVAAFYWGFFHALAGTTLGASLARLTESNSEAEKYAAKSVRFR